MTYGRRFALLKPDLLVLILFLVTLPSGYQERRRLDTRSHCLPDSQLNFAVAAEGQGAIKFEVRVDDQPVFESTIPVLEQVSLADLSWEELDLNLWAGKGVEITLATSLESGEAEGLWLMPQLVTDSTWLLPDPPSNLLYTQVNSRFDESVELLGFVAVDQEIAPGGELTLSRSGDLFGMSASMVRCLFI